MKLDRDDVRAAYDELHRDGVTHDELKLLRKEINKEMKASDCYGGTMRMRKKVGPFMSCKCDQWEKREAVSFNRDGFIGFAGWADENNVQPILRGFQSWMEKIKEPAIANDGSKFGNPKFAS